METRREERPREHESRDGGDPLISRAMPETPAKHQELGERHGRALWPSEGSQPANTWTSHLQNCETLNICCLHHSVCAVLFGQCEPTDREYMPEWLLRSLIITKSHQVTACLWSPLRKDANESQLFRDILSILDVGKGTVNGVNLSCCGGTPVDWKDPSLSL